MVCIKNSWGWIESETAWNQICAACTCFRDPTFSTAPQTHSTFFFFFFLPVKYVNEHAHRISSFYLFCVCVCSEDRIRNGCKKIVKSRQGSTQGRLDSFFTVTGSLSSKRKVHVRKLWYWVCVPFFCFVCLFFCV